MARMREILLGNARGMTAWDRLRRRWQREKAAEERERAFARAFNPLHMKPGDLVEIEGETWEVEALLWFHTPKGSPDYVRYSAKHMQTGALCLLEAIPEGRGDDDRLVLSRFELVDELDWDEELLDVLQHEDVLRHAEVVDGEEAAVDYRKDFETDAELTFFTAEDHAVADVTTFNYFHEGPDGESYLAVDASPEQRSLCFYRGRRIEPAAILALGTAGAR
jgi:hypothetical protein